MLIMGNLKGLFCWVYHSENVDTITEYFPKTKDNMLHAQIGL
jgi:hypothetical protein